MALEDSNATPVTSATPSPVTPAPDPNAPPVVNAPAPAMDLSGLSQPGSSLVPGQAAPNLQGTTEYKGYQSATDAAAAAAKKASDIANQPTPASAGGHQKLLSMVQGLAAGLSGFGKAIATRGAEGGAAETTQILGAEQQQKQQAIAAQQAQKNAAVQQQVVVGETNRQLAQSYLNLMTMPDEITANHLKVQSAQQGLTAGNLENIGKTQDVRTKALQDFVQTGDMDSYNKTLSQLGGSSAATTPGVLAGTAPATGPGAPAVTIPPAAIATWKNSVDSAVSAYPNDPQIKQYAAVLANPNSKSTDMAMAAGGAKNRMVALDAGAESRTKQGAAEIAGLPKNQQEAAVQLAAAQNSGDPARIAQAQAVKDSVDQIVQQERKFSSDLQAQNQAANKQITFSNTLAQKGIEDTNKLWTDPQHGFAQTRARVEATKNVVMQAKSGSELAASLEPAMTVLGVNSFAGVHRISPTEYEAAGPQVGSLYRRLNAVLDKTTKGAVPAATLSEIDGIMDSLVRSKYSASVDSTRQIVANAGIPAKNISVPDPNNYGALTTLDKIPVTATPGGNAAPSMTRLVDASGNHYDVPSANVAAAIKQHPELKAAQ